MAFDEVEDDPFAPKDDESNPWAKYPWHVEEPISRTTAALSLFGSTWIIVEVLRNQNRRKLAYHRIMLGLSIYDFLSSFWFFIGPWAHGDDQSVFDNTATPACKTSGFFIYLASICIPIYNAVLSIYFLLVIKYRWREDQIVRMFERYIHIAIFVVGIIPAVTAFAYQQYGQWYQYCYVKQPPQQKYFSMIAWFSTLSSALIVIGAMIAITMMVLNLEKRNERYQFDRSSQLNESSNRSFVQGALSSMRRSTIGNSGGDNRGQKARFRRSREVTKIAILYTLPFYATWVVSCIMFTIANAYINKLGSREEGIHLSPRASFVFNIYIATMLPLQGFLNWLIYIRPQIKQSCEHCKLCCNFSGMLTCFSRSSTKTNVNPPGEIVTEVARTLENDSNGDKDQINILSCVSGSHADMIDEEKEECSQVVIDLNPGELEDDVFVDQAIESL